MRGAVAFQGVFGAFSHEACLQAAPDHEPHPYDSFEAAFAAVGQGACALGVFPVENSIAGVVPEVARLLPSSGLQVLREHNLPIRLQLLGLAGSSLADARTAESHPMALGQCRRALAAFRLTERVSFDTAGAARDVAAAGDPSRTAVASRTAAELYGLSILRADIEDGGDNRTRFVIVARGG